MYINITLDKEVYQNNSNNINKNQLKEVKEELILKISRIKEEINENKDYIVIKSLRRIMGKLFEIIEDIKDLEDYLEELNEK